SVASCSLFFSLTPPFTSLFFFFQATPTPAIYTLSLHDALPICCRAISRTSSGAGGSRAPTSSRSGPATATPYRSCRPTWPMQRRSEEHTSELQSRENLVCRLLLEKKKHTDNNLPTGQQAHTEPQ